MVEGIKDKAQIKEQIKQALEKNNQKVSPKLQHMLEEAVFKMETEMLQPKDVLGFDASTMEQIYTYGYNLFQAGKYREALPVFSFLRQIDILDTRYPFCIAACHHYLKEYNEAAANYIICGYIHYDEPVSRFHLYDCFMKLNQPMSALRAILECINMCDQDPKYDVLKEKAKLEYQDLQKHLKVYFKERYGADAVVEDDKGDSL